MIKAIRKTVHKILLWLRQTKLRNPIIKVLVWIHNTSYHMISLFASNSGLHPKHEIMKYEQFFLQNVNPSTRVLDVGSGNGKIAYDVSEKAKEVTGIDIRTINVKKARERYSRGNLTFTKGDATSMDIQDQFDTIILSNVLEHIEHRVEFLKKLSRIAPIILIRVPMLTRDWITVFKKNEGLEYRLDDTHYIEYTTEIFEQEMEEAGLTIENLSINFGEIYAIVKRKS